MFIIFAQYNLNTLTLIAGLTPGGLTSLQELRVPLYAGGKLAFLFSFYKGLLLSTVVLFIPTMTMTYDVLNLHMKLSTS